MRLKALMFRWLGVLAMSLLAGVLPVAGAQQQEKKEKRQPNEPSFSRDAKRIVYVEQVFKGGEVLASLREIWTVNTDGTNARRLTEGPEDDHPRFSPDDRQIAFERDKDIWLINADGSNARNVTNTKDEYEQRAEFTNDGKSLIFLRGGFAPKVALRHLDSGEERILLGNDYDVEQVVPHPADNNAVFIVCKPLDNDGKPVQEVTLDKIIAVLKLDGTPVRAVFAPKPDSKLRIDKIRVSPTRNLLQVDKIDEADTHTALLENGGIVLLPDAPMIGDVSFDGKLIVGNGQIDELFTWGLVLYDIETKKSGSPSKFKDAIPARAKEFYDKGRELFTDDRYIEAIAEFTKAIVVHPPYAEAYHQRAWAHDMNDNKESALRDLGEAIRLNPKNAKFYLTRARIYQDQERTGEALDDLTAAIAADQQNADAYYQRGELYVAREELAAAIADFDAAIKIDPNSLAHLIARGDALHKQGDNPAAIKDYTQAIKHFPTSWVPYHGRSKAYRAMGQKDLAAADEKKVQELKAKP